MYDLIIFFQMFIYNDLKVTHLQVYNSQVARQGSFL